MPFLHTWSLLGAGYIGLEFAQMMQRFGSKVTVLERGEQILSREDAEIAEALANCVFGNGARSRSDRYVPSTLFTDPELAHVGLTEKQATARRYEIGVLKVRSLR